MKRFLSNFLSSLPPRRIILFESRPDLSDNTKPVFDEIVNRGINKKYKLIWLCFDGQRIGHKKIKNVIYLDANKHRIIVAILNRLSKATISCNRFLGCKRKKQCNIFLAHGGAIKDSRSYYSVPNYIDWMITLSPNMNKKSSEDCNFPIVRCIPLGYPRNDAFNKSKLELGLFFGHFKKYIVWYPTVKQFKNGLRTGCVQPISFLNDEDKIKTLNNQANKSGVLIIIKPHFAQLTELINKIELSNIVFIDDDFFKNNSIEPYHFVGSCDALITDYSSIYYDFTLCDKPICLIWDDIDSYKKNPGLIDGYEEMMRGGEKVFVFEELLAFVSRVANGVDLLEKERNDVCDEYIAFRDGQSTKRVVDFIVKEAKL